jgi:hypothetical protein
VWYSRVARVAIEWLSPPEREIERERVRDREGEEEGGRRKRER